MKNFYKQFVNGVMLTTVGTSTTLLFHFFSIMLMARFVTKENLGIYFLGLAFSQFLKLFSNMGLNLNLVREASQLQDNSRSTIIPTILHISFFMALLIALLFYALQPLIDHYDFYDQISSLVHYLIIIFVLLSVRDILNNMLQGFKMFKQYAFLQSAAALFKFLLILAAANFNLLDIYTLLIIEMLFYSFSILFLFWLLPAWVFKFTDFDHTLIKQIFGFSTPLFLNTLFHFLYTRASLFLIGFFTGAASVASFSMANKIPEACTQLYRAINVVYFPNISKLYHEQNYKGTTEFINYMLILISVIILLGTLFSYLFANEIIVFFFSKEYLDIVPVFLLLLFNFELNTISNILGYSSVAAGKPSASMKISFVTSIIGVLGYYFLIPIYGYIAVVFVMIAMSLLSFLCFYFVLKKCSLKVNYTTLLKPFLIFFTLVFLHYYLNLGYWYFNILFLIVYCFLCYILIDEVKLSCYKAYTILRLFFLKKRIVDPS